MTTKDIRGCCDECWERIYGSLDRCKDAKCPCHLSHSKPVEKEISAVAVEMCGHGKGVAGFMWSCVQCKTSWEAHIRKEEREALIGEIEGLKKELDGEPLEDWEEDVGYNQALDDLKQKITSRGV